MQPKTKLLLVKCVHTIIWFFFVIVIGYVLYAGFADVIDATVWIAIGLVMLEGFILLMNEGRCPLTSMGMRYTERTDDNFDIFLPSWLARHNKTIFTTIFALGVLIVLYRVFS